MQRRAAQFAGLVALCVTAMPALAAPTAYDTAFVKAFEDACVPGRLGYQSSKDAAVAAGWSEAARDEHGELAAVLALSDAAAKAAAVDPEIIDPIFQMAVYGKDIEGLPHFLVVDEVGSVISGDDKPFVQVGCYLYNFDATSPVDPAPVTALIGKPISNTAEAEGVLVRVWGPGCTMPRTFDTYLHFVAEGSEVAEQVPFTGVALNFSTSVPAPDEVVPETYC